MARLRLFFLEYSQSKIMEYFKNTEGRSVWTEAFQAYTQYN
ncbi:conserved hypothetical protein [Xenorhabdus bovienii str. feltiae Moldova]|uniref:Uncharacterized protein n=1 Tax=Xenorhabdus bovienii str. feltiae Moldova TaxID=1398200 RepID=A0A077NLB1_XENBV|nr:conserved hypothetical protein [Xenorhabdus bovienii str. feltiae Moldova]